MNFEHFPGFPGKANFNQFYWLYFGLSLAPRIFPEFNKPLTPFLSLPGHEPVEYSHEIWLVGITVKEVSAKQKSVLSPSIRIEILGFYFNSTQVTVPLPMEKIEKTYS